ncbi:hypothetical protein [Virgibacillus halodenitrificans]|uniref:hypothetical protein n=1 Tax=Virgibacillus halodenitrificans TaxID=1482 RepID=UPI000EF52449|nr:hypothetical protein [Virgibacillus halodenitrificans]
MENLSIRSAKSIVSKLDKRSDIEYIRVSLYSVLVTILLSKEIFNKNDDIKDFLQAMNIHYKGYVYKSRTLIVARVIRDIKSADDEKLHLYLTACKKILFPNLNNKINVPKKDKTSVDELIRHFKRK